MLNCELSLPFLWRYSPNGFETKAFKMKRSGCCNSEIFKMDRLVFSRNLEEIRFLMKI